MSYFFDPTDITVLNRKECLCNPFKDPVQVGLRSLEVFNIPLRCMCMCGCNAYVYGNDDLCPVCQREVNCYLIPRLLPPLPPAIPLAPPIIPSPVPIGVVEECVPLQPLDIECQPTEIISENPGGCEKHEECHCHQQTENHQPKECEKHEECHCHQQKIENHQRNQCQQNCSNQIKPNCQEFNKPCQCRNYDLDQRYPYQTQQNYHRQNYNRRYHRF